MAGQFTVHWIEGYDADGPTAATGSVCQPTTLKEASRLQRLYAPVLLHEHGRGSVVILNDEGAVVLPHPALEAAERAAAGEPEDAA